MDKKTATTNGIILKESSRLKHLGLIMICLETIIAAWILHSLFGSTDWSNTSTSEYAITFSSLLLAVGLAFLFYAFISPLPKKDSEAIIYKQKEFQKPTFLRILLTIQIVTILYGAYSANAWAQLDAINIFGLNKFYDVFVFISFIALHIAVIIGLSFFVKLAKLNRLLANSSTESATNSSIKKTYKYIAVLCIAVLIPLVFRLAPRLSQLFTETVSVATLGSLSFLIFLANIALCILLICFFIVTLRKKNRPKAKSLYAWLAALLSVDLYISVGVITSNFSLFLLHPEVMLLALLCAVFEALLLLVLVSLSTYNIIASRFTFLNEAVNVLQKAFANNTPFTRAFGKIDDENNEAAKAYLHFAVDASDKQGDMLTLKQGAFLGWIMGEHFPPISHDESLAKYKEVELFEKHEAAPEKIIADNAQNFGYIWLLGTTPEARGKGLAKTLIEKALHQMYNAGVEECWLSTENSSNVDYYQKFGFEPFAEQVSEFGVTTHVMVNKLNNRTLITNT